MKEFNYEEDLRESILEKNINDQRKKIIKVIILFILFLIISISLK